MDFLEKLKEHIEALDTFANVVDIGLLNDGNSICLRSTPSQPPSRYLNRDEDYTYGFQILVRNDSHLLSINTLQSIVKNLTNLLPKEITSDNNSFIFTKISLSNTPNLVERDNKGWIYTALFTADIHLKN